MADSYPEGKQLAKAGDFEAALPLLEMATEERPDSPDVWLALAACYFRLDRNDDFRDAIRQSLAIDSKHPATLRFLKKTTGAEVVPAPGTGREKIYMEVGGPAKRCDPVPPRSESGCLGTFLASGLVFFGWRIFVSFSI